MAALLSALAVSAAKMVARQPSIAGAAATAGGLSVTLTVGSDLPPAVVQSVRAHLAPWLGSGADSLQLHFGAIPACSELLASSALADVGPEGFCVMRSGPVVCALGNPSAPAANYSLGSAYAAYDLLERLGFAFLHPLQLIPPVALTDEAVPDGSASCEGPAFAYRGFHIHTEHPLELVEVLQGADATLPNGSVVPWASMLDGVARMFEWLVANRQNRVEWVLLMTPEWRASGWLNSTQRQQRLRVLTDMCRSFALQCGADVPIAEVQQRGWHMVDFTQPLPAMLGMIRERLHWLLHPSTAGFDFISTENGFTEFTHGDCSLMLQLISAMAQIAAEAHGARAYIKCHASTGQRCPSIPDPRTGAPINFNFLPMLASPLMGVMPHTVQAYALDDLTDGAYGNDDFRALRLFMEWEAANGSARRDVVFHPETDYWVNVDIDVPLFLPLYGERRLHDLRSIASDARIPPGRVAGQNNFDSGWEWGSWLSDVVAARAAWDPHSHLPADADASSAFGAAVGAVLQLLRRGGDLPCAAVDEVVASLVRLAAEQRQVLIYGVPPPSTDRTTGAADGLPPPTPAELRVLSGFGYLSGRDAWTDLLSTVGVADTQPGKIDFYQHRHPLYPRVEPLLSTMNDTFASTAAALSAAVDAAVGGAPSAAKADSAAALLRELADGATVLALRAEFVKLLYAASAPDTGRDAKRQILEEAREVLARARAVVGVREAHYRVDVERIAGWRSTVTSYGHGYLWSVKSLYFWWREYGRVERGSVEARLGPCYLNKQYSIDVAFGSGRNLSSFLRRATRRYVPLAGNEFGDCFAPPKREYVFPQDLYAYGVSHTTASVD